MTACRCRCGHLAVQLLVSRCSLIVSRFACLSSLVRRSDMFTWRTSVIQTPILGCSNKFISFLFEREIKTAEVGSKSSQVGFLCLYCTVTECLAFIEKVYSSDNGVIRKTQHGHEWGCWTEPVNAEHHSSSAMNFDMIMLRLRSFLSTGSFWFQRDSWRYSARHHENGHGDDLATSKARLVLPGYFEPDNPVLYLPGYFFRNRVKRPW